MRKFSTVVILGLLLGGCTIPSLSDLPSRKPGELIIICPDGQAIINDGKSACTGFMQTDETVKKQ